MQTNDVTQVIYVFPEEDGYEMPKWGKSKESSPEINEELGEPIAGIYLPTLSPDIKIDIKPGQEWFWTDEWQTAEKEVERDLASGNFETFDTVEEFLADLE